jgi:hypothetical protein
MSLGWSTNSVIHTGLSTETLNQIKKRGETLKKVSGRTTNDLIYLNSKTSWVKVSSAVDVDPDGGTKFSSETAKSNVLAGGVLNSKQKMRAGIFNNTDDAYILDSVGSGYRPIPGLTGFQSEILGTYGTYQRVAIDFQCNSIDQLSVMEQLYCRPGMNLLVEWGHTIYKKNNGEVVTTIQTISNFFDNVTSDEEKESNKKRVYDQINTLKENSDGNYDGFLGRITNFNYKFNIDGTYSCQVVVLAHGALLESVRLLISSTTSEDTTTSTANIAKDISRFTKFFNIILDQGLLGTTEETITALKAGIPKDYNLFEKRLEKSKRELKILSIAKASAEGEKDEIIKFVPLSVVLEMINLVFCPKNDVDEDINDVEFYTERGNKETSYLTFPGHFSLNPTICFLPKARALNFPLSYFFTNADSSILPSRQDDILDIMVSVNYILKVFNDMIDPSKTDIKDQSVYDYVRVVLKGISDSLGDINLFDFHYEDQEDKAYIVDRKITPQANDIKDSLLEIRGTETSMLNFSITSKASADMMTTMAIGASAQGTDLGEDMLNVQSWNKGLRDRFNSNPGFLGDNTSEDQAEESISQQKFGRLVDYICEVDRSEITEGSNGKLEKKIRDESSIQNDPFYYINYNANDASAIRPVYNKVMQDLYKAQTKKEQQNAAGLIPIDVSFSMVGISGFKIGQAFTIQKGTLPTKYDGKVGFIITGLSHVIGSDNKWKTDINGKMCILSQAEISGKEDFNIDDFITEGLRVTEIPAPDTPILFWPISTSFVPYKFSENGLGSEGKRNFINSSTREGAGTTGSGKFGAKRGARQHAGLDIIAKPNRSIIAPIGGSVRFISEFTAKGGHGIEITGTGDYVGYSVKIGYINVGYDQESLLSAVSSISNLAIAARFSKSDISTRNVFKETVKAGELICYATNMVDGSFKQTSDGKIITDKNNTSTFFPGYGGDMTNHIHLEIRYNGALINPVKAPYQTRSLTA